MKTLRNALLTSLCIVAASIYAGADPAEKRCIDCNPLHPDIPLQYEAGGTLSEEKSCGPCHDISHVMKNNTHNTKTVKARCITCHYTGPLAPESFAGGAIRKDRMKIAAPTNATCGRCHGVTGNGAPLQVPDDFGRVFSYREGGATYRLTQRTGEIISGQDIALSGMNIAGKAGLSYPWDTHARRNVTCASCHASPNSPRISGRVATDEDARGMVRYLTHDPRRASSLWRYLQKPGHALVTPRCESCHDAERVHKKLPYRQRHLSVLSCQSCHVPRLYGPAIRTLDYTTVFPDGSPRVEYRGVKNPDERNLNIAYTEGYSPYLMAAAKQGGDHTLSPYNLVTTWKWVEGNSGEDVPAKTVSKAFLDKGAYRPEILKAFDRNKNGSLEAREMALDTKEKIEIVKKALISLGIPHPAVKGSVATHRVNHGIAEGKIMTLQCGDCHRCSSRFGNQVELSALSPFGVTASLAGNNQAWVNGSITREGPSLVLNRNCALQGHYVFGFSRNIWLDALGILLFLATAASIGGHIFLRWRARKIFGPVHHEERVKIRRYRFYERLWHWSMALTVILLLLTGLGIHYAGKFSFIDLETSVRMHNVLAVLVVLNSGMSLFYHAATGEIRQFFRFGKSFGKELTAQVLFYVYGVFKRTHHPVMTGPKRKYNPLQQLTYTVLLNVLFPWQILTGMLMWAVGYFPSFGKAIGGLSIIGPLHNLGSWTFLTFIIIHIYLVSTGKHLWSFLEGMITGEMEEEYEEDSRQVLTMLLALKPKDLIENVRTLLKGKQA